MATPAQVAQRREAGRKSGKARGRRTDQDQSSDADPDAPVPASSDPEVDRVIAGYLAMAGKPRFWSDIKALEQVRAEIYRTRAAARADRIESGALMTKDQVRTRDESHAQAFRSGLQSVNELLTKHVPADRLLAAQKEAREWVDGVLTKVAESIGGKE